MNNEYGLFFPIIIDNGTPAEPGLEDSIESSIRIILAYDIGHRFFLGSFGSILDSLIGAPNTHKAHGIISLFVVKAITRWERRLYDIDSEVSPDGEFVLIDMSGIISDVKKTFNYQITA